MRRRDLALAALSIAMVMSLTGCVGGIQTATLKPRLSPPVIVRPAVLRVAIDLGYPPFGGRVKGVETGLDVDVASAIAQDLGLKLEVVDAKSEQAIELLRKGKVDLVMGALTVEQAVAADLAFAGTYVADAPALFSAHVASATIDDIAGKTVAVQRGSGAYWVLVDEYGEEALTVVPTLLDAMKAAGSGKADLAAGDALTGAYITRQVPNVSFSGQLEPASPLGVGVSKDKPQLEQEVRRILDRLASKGVLDTLRRKWVGELPRLVAGSSEGSPTVTP